MFNLIFRDVGSGSPLSRPLKSSGLGAGLIAGAGSLIGGLLVLMVLKMLLSISCKPFAKLIRQIVILPNKTISLMNVCGICKTSTIRPRCNVLVWKLLDLIPILC